MENDVNPIQVSVAREMGATLVDLHTAMDTDAGGLNPFFREGDGVMLWLYSDRLAYFSEEPPKPVTEAPLCPKLPTL